MYRRLSLGDRCWLLLGLSSLLSAVACQSGTPPTGVGSTASSTASSTATASPRPSAWKVSASGTLASVASGKQAPNRWPKHWWLNATKVNFEASAMGTTIRFVAYSTPEMPKARLEQAMKQAMDRIADLEQQLSAWRDDSQVSAINRAGGKPTVVDANCFAIIQKSQWISELSDGAFDISFQVMSTQWRFGDAQKQNPTLPDGKELDRLRQLIDYRKIQLDHRQRTITLPADMRIGLGGIAKGYVLDQAAAVLRAAGIHNFLAQAGGDLLGAGRKPDGSAWVSGIRDPRGADDSYFATIELSDRAFSTAGDYARAFVLDGKRYHHIIDPNTGYPAALSRSVTVWAKTAFEADAIDDAVFILGASRGLELVESLPGVGAVIVDQDNKVWVSERLKGLIKIDRPPTPGL
ncbi:MAG: FAD:protein FMN transferase [Polyangiaceae bacterium]|nr:FAD:protein FMN transferase [Polyangiaceae bacterium]